ncbi:S41 family peptidase [Bacteroides sp. KG156]|uniref:S41 family peptidase n=2 Tax=Bacteroides TaxID=816 RepID=UPI003D968F8E
MKLIHYFICILFTLTTISLGSCHDDDNSIQSGITHQSWTEGTALEITPSKILSVTFNAAAKWTATTNSNWCSVLTPSGEKGQSTLQLSTTTGTSVERTSIITIKVDGYSTISFDVKQNIGEAVLSEDMKVNTKVAQYLREMYLWNDEYKTLKLDYTKEYSAFFYEPLKSMTTNTLDKKRYTDSDGKTYYNLFSYINKRAPITRTRAAKLVEKELSYSFGITGATLINLRSSSSESIFYICIQGIYPDSPAASAGIKRGAMISKINGEKLNKSNLKKYYYSLVLPDKALNLTLTEDIIEKGEKKGTKDVSLTSKAMYLNPVITSKVDEINGHKIGYLVYSEFDASFDQELFDAFKNFKKQNVTDLILDLRYNGGGHTLSANLLASCIAADASLGKTFTSLRFNKERMEKRNNKQEIDLFAYPNHYRNLDTPLTDGGLGLKRVYCLVSGNTASASELVINSLRGIDLEVILIGEKTRGKNVGMEYEDYAVEGYIYRIAPITFQSYNAKGFGDYENGFEPDAGLKIKETNPFNEEGKFYILKDYGTNEEPLYAKAIELITGKNPMKSATTRGAGKTLQGWELNAPALHRPGYDGMLKKYEE